MDVTKLGSALANSGIEATSFRQLKLMISCSDGQHRLGTQKKKRVRVLCVSKAWHPHRPPRLPAAHLSERLAQLTQDAFLIKHLALVAMFIVVMDALSSVWWELVEGHVLLYLFILRWETDRSHFQAPRAGHQRHIPTLGLS